MKKYYYGRGTYQEISQKDRQRKSEIILRRYKIIIGCNMIYTFQWWSGTHHITIKKKTLFQHPISWSKTIKFWQEKDIFQLGW